MVLKTNDLAQFTGTAQYHKWSPLFQNIVLTDGAMHVAEEGGAFWLMDAIASYQSSKFRNDNPFQVWELKVQDESGELVCDDGNGNKLITQKINYTDFPLDKIKLYFQDGVILLPSEY